HPCPLIAKVVTVTAAGVCCAEAAGIAKSGSMAARRSRRIVPSIDIRAGASESLPREPGLVLPAVVVEVLARLDPLPPLAVRAVPLDGLGEAFLERPLALPAEPAQLRVVQRVAAVVTRPVVDVPDERRIGAGQLEDPFRHVEVLAL